MDKKKPRKNSQRWSVYWWSAAREQTKPEFPLDVRICTSESAARHEAEAALTDARACSWNAGRSEDKLVVVLHETRDFTQPLKSANPKAWVLDEESEVAMDALLATRPLSV